MLLHMDMYRQCERRRLSVRWVLQRVAEASLASPGYPSHPSHCRRSSQDVRPHAVLAWPVVMLTVRPNCPSHHPPPCCVVRLQLRSLDGSDCPNCPSYRQMTSLLGPWNDS